MRRSFLQTSIAAGAIALIPLAALSSSTAANADNGSYRELETFMQVFGRVKASYVDKVDDQTLVKGAIAGMLAALDPHSGYDDGVDFDNLKIQTDGTYGGLGLTVTQSDGAVKVISATEDTPASRAGIKSGDFITHLDGKFIVGGSLDDAISQMRGTPGTKVSLTVVRPGADKPLQFTLTREVIVTKPVKWELKGEVGYININTFNANTGADTAAAVRGIDAKLGHKPLGYVVDLRENGGGLLSEAIGVADVFLTHGEVVSERGRDPTDIQRFYAESVFPGDLAGGKPVVVLVDAGTASASEIVAGALQDQHRALIMGERSFGKGSVQSLIQMGPRQMLRLTTARYFTPSGHSVQEGGIKPDVVVPQLSDPDYKDRPVLREADLQHHLINQAKVDDAVLEDDAKPDPRFSLTADELKKQGIDDFQLDYAIRTIARLGGPARIASKGK